MTVKKVVVDTSVVLAVAMQEPTAAEIREQIGKAEWYAPESLHYEIGNALGNRLSGRRKPQLTGDHVWAVLDHYEGLRILFEDIDLRLAMQLVEAMPAPLLAYDAYVMALALDKELPLATVDRKMAAQARDLGVDVIYFGPER